MHTLKPAATECLSVTLVQARVAMVLDATHCLLGSGLQAVRAYACLVELQAGDLVLVAQSEAACHVLQVLERATPCAAAALSVAAENGLGDMALRGGKLSLHAIDTLELMSARDASVTAATGSLALNSHDLFVTVAENLVQQSRHFIGKAGQYLLEVRHLLKLHGQDALITAERDIKADAERISMG